MEHEESVSICTDCSGGAAQQRSTPEVVLHSAASAADVDAELPYLRMLARRLTLNAEDAHDLVQDAMVRALPALGKVAVGSHLRAWLITILRRMHIDRLRRIAREPEAVPIEEADLAVLAREPDDSEPPSAVDGDTLAAALAALPDGFRRVFELHELEGRSYREIAELLSIPLATVGTRLSRARLKLRGLLGERAALRHA